MLTNITEYVIIWQSWCWLEGNDISHDCIRLWAYVASILILINQWPLGEWSDQYHVGRLHFPMTYLLVPNLTWVGLITEMCCWFFFQLRSDAKSNPWPPDLQANVQATSRAWLIIYCPAGWATHQHLPLRSNASLVVSHYLLSRCLSGPCTLPAVFQCLSCLVWLFIVPQFELSLYIFLCLPTPLLSCILYSTPSTSVFWPVGKHSDTLPLLVSISRSSF